MTDRPQFESIIRELNQGPQLAEHLRHLAGINLVVVHGMAEACVSQLPPPNPTKLYLLRRYNESLNLTPDVDIFIPWRLSEAGQVDGNIVTSTNGVLVLDRQQLQDRGPGYPPEFALEQYVEDHYVAIARNQGVTLPHDHIYERVTAGGRQMLVIGEGASVLDEGQVHQRRQIAVAEVMFLQLHGDNSIAQELANIGYPPGSAAGTVQFTDNGLDLVPLEAGALHEPEATNDPDVQLSRVRLALKQSLQSLLRDPVDLLTAVASLSPRVAALLAAVDTQNKFYLNCLLTDQDNSLVLQALGLLDILAPCFAVDPVQATLLFEQSGLFELLFGRQFLQSEQYGGLNEEMCAATIKYLKTPNLLQYLGRLSKGGDFSPYMLLSKLITVRGFRDTAITKIDLLENVNVSATLANPQNSQAN